MSRTIAIGSLLFAVATLPIVHADSYRPFRNFRQVDPTGRYYIVVKKNGGPKDPGAGTPVTFEIAERKPGSPPVKPSEDGGSDDAIVTNSEVSVREGDLVLGQGSLKRSPRLILVSSIGLGFVGLDVRGYNYGDLRSGDTLVIVSTDGKVRHHKDLIDLFSEKEVNQFTRSVGGVFWLGGGWIDEARREVIVVGSREWPDEKPIPRLFRIVNLETGVVRQGSSALILTALSERNLGALHEAIELAGELKLNEAKPDLVKMFSDDKLSLDARLRTCVALAAVGDRRGGSLMTKSVFEDSLQLSYAIRDLPSVIGDDAAPVLCDVVRRFGSDVSALAWDAMHRVSGEAAVAPLLLLLRDGHCPVCIDFAVECLGLYGRKATTAIPDLIKLLETKPKTINPVWTQQLAALALGRIGPESRAALPALTQLAETHARDEWEKLKSQQPEKQRNVFGDMQYSDDYFIDAICRIRQR
jgi:HEAT repeat protein